MEPVCSSIALMPAGNTTTNTTTYGTLGQTRCGPPPSFNFFYPNYEFPGKTSGTQSMAQLGMTTPEFQLTDATDTLNLTNAQSRRW
jgi:hypothetical protein